MLRDRNKIEQLIEMGKKVHSHILIVGEEGSGKTTHAKHISREYGYKLLSEILLLTRWQHRSLRYRILKSLNMPIGRDSLRGYYLIVDDGDKLTPHMWDTLKLIGDFTGLGFIVFATNPKSLPAWLLLESISYSLKGITSQEDMDFFVQRVLGWDMPVRYDKSLSNPRGAKTILLKEFLMNWSGGKRNVRAKAGA